MFIQQQSQLCADIETQFSSFKEEYLDNIEKNLIVKHPQLHPSILEILNKSKLHALDWNISSKPTLTTNATTNRLKLKQWKWYRSWFHISNFSNTVKSHHNMVNSIQTTHSRYPIAHLWGWAMGYLLCSFLHSHYRYYTACLCRWAMGVLRAHS